MNRRPICVAMVLFISSFCVPSAVAGSAFYEVTDLISTLPEGERDTRPSLAVSGGRLLIGDFVRNKGELDYVGAAFVYRSENGLWVQEAELDLPAEDDARGGARVALDGTTAAVLSSKISRPVTVTLPTGTVLERESLGVVSLFERTASGWGEPVVVTPGNRELRNFGFGLALCGNTLAVSDAFVESSDGIVLMFRREGGIWVEDQVVQDTEPGLQGGFGSALAFVDENLIAIGIQRINGGKGGVALYARREGGGWSFQEMLVVPDPEITEGLGRVMAAGEGRIVVGAPREEESRGAAYIFTRSQSGTWETGVRVVAEGREEDDLFGAAVAVAGDCVVIGALGEDSIGALNNRNAGDNSVRNAGATYVFTPGETAGSWSQTAFLKSPSADSTGESVGIDAASGTIFHSGDKVVTQQTPAEERPVVEVEVTVFSPDEASPIAGPAVFGLGEPWLVDAGGISIRSTNTSVTIEYPRGGTFDEGDCVCLRVRDTQGNLPAILGVSIGENVAIPSFTTDQITFTEDMVLTNTSGLEFFAGPIRIDLELAAAGASPQITAVSRTADGLKLKFRAEPGRTDWLFSGGLALSEFSTSGITVTSLVEMIPGSYDAELQIPGGGGRRFFLRVGSP